MRLPRPGKQVCLWARRFAGHWPCHPRQNGCSVRKARTFLLLQQAFRVGVRKRSGLRSCSPNVIGARSRCHAHSRRYASPSAAVVNGVITEGSLWMRVGLEHELSDLCRAGCR